MLQSTFSLRCSEGVVQLYGTFEDEQHVSLVMEHCTAGDLFKTMLVHGGILDEHWVAIQARVQAVGFLQTPPRPAQPMQSHLSGSSWRTEASLHIHSTRIRRLVLLGAHFFAVPVVGITWGGGGGGCGAVLQQQQRAATETIRLRPHQQVVAPLLGVLTRLHEEHILHRDIKPENLFLTRKRQLKLGDFGLAIRGGEELPFTRSGTLDYMAPEVNHDSNSVMYQYINDSEANLVDCATSQPFGLRCESPGLRGPDTTRMHACSRHIPLTPTAGLARAQQPLEYRTYIVWSIVTRCREGVANRCGAGSGKPKRRTAGGSRHHAAAAAGTRHQTLR